VVLLNIYPIIVRTLNPTTLPVKKIMHQAHGTSDPKKNAKNKFWEVGSTQYVVKGMASIISCRQNKSL